MADHIALTPHLTREPNHDALVATFIGQAHIAGTGPEGATCRECRFWCEPDGEGTIGVLWLRYSPRHKTKAGDLKRHRCRYRIPNKPRRRVPHDAKACRFFDRNPSPPPVTV